MAERTLVHAGRLIDVTSAEVLEARTIVVDDDRVVEVRDGFSDPAAGEKVVDLKTATVMPGWLDMHVHIAGEQSPRRQMEAITLDPADHAYRSVVYARRTLMAGFTTVRDLGTASGLAQSLRDAIAGGWIVGPRIMTAGKALASTGGHGDPSNGVNQRLASDPGPIDGVVNSEADAYKGVRARYKEGSDLIKITATGGVLSQAKSGQNPQFTIAEIEAIVAAARDYGFKVAAHAHGTEGMRRAVLGGVDSIEHGTYMSDEVMKLMRRRGTYYVPTIIAGRFVADKAEIPGFFSELVRPKAAAIGPLIQDTFARAYAAGVPIAFGTDTGVSPHGDNWKEFTYMIEAGMPAMEAIVSATVSAADLLDRSEDLGSIDPGKLADIIAVPGDPLTDPAEFGRVHFVMKGGVIFKQGERP
jgi:imidazolonepropionase-like amidohydrolase